jgi:hypothetical protein
MVRFFGRIAFLTLVTSVFAGETLNELVTAAQEYIATSRQPRPSPCDKGGFLGNIAYALNRRRLVAVQ